MRQASSTEHTLEAHPGYTDAEWVKANEDVYRAAHKLAYQGRLVEAIKMAEGVLLQGKSNRDLDGAAFRVVTTTKTVTVLGPFDDAVF